MQVSLIPALMVVLLEAYRDGTFLNSFSFSRSILLHVSNPFQSYYPHYGILDHSLRLKLEIFTEDYRIYGSPVAG